jgi:hypothetical protein
MIFAKRYQQFSLCYQLSEIVNRISIYEIPHEVFSPMKPGPQNGSRGQKDYNFHFDDITDKETNFLIPVGATSRIRCPAQKNTQLWEWHALRDFSKPLW